MMTLQGDYITLDSGAPSIEAIALGLSRMPRFAGQTLFEWTVADHLIVCVRYIRSLVQLGLQGTSLLETHVLLHDAHEALTGDIPTTFKTDDMREIQHRLDGRLFASLDLPRPTNDERAIIKQIDEKMLIAEAKVCTPATTYNKILWERKTDAAWPLAVETIEEYLHEDRNPHDAFLGLARELLSIAYFGHAWAGFRV